MSHTHKPIHHSLLWSSSVAFLWMAGVTIWTTNSEMLFAQMSGGGFTLGTAPETTHWKMVQGTLHGAPTTVFDVQAPVDIIAVQLILGTFFLIAGFLFYALLLQRTGEKLRFPFHHHVRNHARRVKHVFNGWMDRKIYAHSR